MAAIAIKLEFPTHSKLSALKSHLLALSRPKIILFFPAKWHMSIIKGGMICPTSTQQLRALDVVECSSRRNMLTLLRQRRQRNIKKRSEWSW